MLSADSNVNAKSNTSSISYRISELCFEDLPLPFVWDLLCLPVGFLDVDFVPLLLVFLGVLGFEVLGFEVLVFEALFLELADDFEDFDPLVRFDVSLLALCFEAKKPPLSPIIITCVPSTNSYNAYYPLSWNSL